MRPRKKNRDLPINMHRKHNAYYFVKGGKWKRLSGDYVEAMKIYAKLATDQGSMAGLINRALAHVFDDLAPNTQRQYTACATRLSAAFMEFAPHEVKTKHVQEYLDGEKGTPAMANRLRSLLKIVFDYAARRGECDTNPVDATEIFEEKGRDRYIFDHEFIAIRAKALPHVALVMDMAYWTGQRPGDVIAIRHADISDEGIYFKQQKTGKKLKVEMTPEILAVIEEAKALHPKVKGLTLFHKTRGEPYKTPSISEGFRKAAKAANVENAQLRDIRAKSLTDAEGQGKNPQLLAGHTSPQTTRRYLRRKEIKTVKGPSFRQK